MSHDKNTSKTDPLEDSTITRRDFARLSAATVGATLALPGNGTAETSSPKMTSRYQYVTDHTPTDYAVPTLVTFADASGLKTMESLVDTEVITTEEPRPAAYAQLTTAQAVEVADLPTAEELSHSPGSNPFWRLDYYPLGVFPEPRRSTGFIDYEQMISGLHHLEEQHDERLNVYSVGESPGHYNYLTDRVDPKDLYVAELTNDVNDTASFEEKTKIMYSLSIHGLERAGAEAGSRFIEGILRGTETQTEQLLDDVVLIFVYPNPDGWVAKHPQYGSSWQLGDTGPTGKVPGAPFYERGNAEVYDTNRQYPTVGWIDPTHYPAEPDGENLEDDDPGIDTDVPDDILAHVPDALSFVEHFRDYENLEYGADLHGALWLSQFVLGLISQHQFANEEYHELYQMNQAVDETLEDALDTWTTAGDARETLLGDTNVKALYEILPEEAFDYSGIWDTIGYTDSGFFGDWMAHPEELGGLGLTSMDFEMAYTHMVGANVYNPELVEMQVTGYRTAIRTIAEYATREVKSEVDTGSDDIAYVTTDALTRTSGDLSFTSDDHHETGDAVGTTGTTSLEQGAESVTLATDETASVSHDVQAGTDTLSVHPHSHRSIGRARLVAPDGTVVREFDPVRTDRLGGRCCAMTHWVVSSPATGTWTVELEPVDLDMDLGDKGEFAVQFATLAANEENPNPADAIGYEQRPYEVDPLTFFEEFAEDATGAVDPVSVGEVADGALVDADGAVTYDHVVVIHDDGIDNGGYVDALDEYVEAGGDVVLTDTGVNLLAPMDNSLANGVAEEHVEDREDLYLGYIGAFPPSFAVTGGDAENKDHDHPLLMDTRPIQKQLYKIAPLGYDVSYEAPMTLVDPAVFGEDGANDENTIATIAGRTGGGDDWVGAASFTHRGESPADDPGDGIHVIGGLLPPANQSHIHPFGMLDYTVSFFGQTVLTNALGAKQVRRVDGEIVQTFGEVDSFEIDGPALGFTAHGSREDDASVFTAGQTNRVEVTVSELSHDAVIRDHFDPAWEFDEEFSDGTEVKDGVVEFGEVSAEAVADDSVTFVYFVEAPDETGRYTFGPAEAIATVGDEARSDTFGGTDTNYVVGVSTNI